jgi:hypothetical protein
MILWWNPKLKVGVYWEGRGPGDTTISFRGKGSKPYKYRYPEIKGDVWFFDLKGDPDNDSRWNENGKGIVVKTGLTEPEEYRRLQNSYESTTMIIEYSVWGPNSNTYIHQLFINAGISVPKPSAATGWDETGDYRYGGKSGPTLHRPPIFFAAD